MNAINTIKYVTGDATLPQGGASPKVVAHICNNVGAWGAGFVIAVSERWGRTLASPEGCYHRWCSQKGWWGPMAEFKTPFILGETQFVMVEGPYQTGTSKTWVANMVAQNNKPNYSHMPADWTPFRPKALVKCLRTVRKFALREGASVHMPRIGAGIGGGDWNEIEQIIQRQLCDHGVSVTVYDLPKG